MAEGPLFIVGCPRSGTGMLRDLLRSHPRISFPPESHFIPRLYRGWGDPADAARAREMGARILGLATVRRWEVDLAPDDFVECRSFAACVDLLFSTYADERERERWGDKTPQYVAELPLLAGLFPSARFIHIIRDGRDVAGSWLRRPHGPQNLYSAALAWRRLVLVGRRDGAALGERYLEVRYELLLADPEATMRRVCEFIGECWDPAMVRPAPRSPRYMSRRVEGMGVPNRTEIDRANSRKWIGAMSRQERALFESVAGDLLDDLDYETEGLGAAIPARRRLAWQLDNRVRMLLAKREFTQFSLADAALLARGELRRRAPSGYRRRT